MTLKVDVIQNTSGGAVTLTAQEAAKSWVNYNSFSGATTTRDSLNISSITDHSAGNHSVYFSNNFANVGYVNIGSVNERDDGNNSSVFFMEGGNLTFASSHTTSYNRITPQSGTGKYDCIGVYSLNIGDLA
jgi:hypothetical protein